MRFHMVALSHALFATIGLSLATVALAEEEPRSGTNHTQQVLQESAEQGRFTFLIFYKANDTATKAMADSVEMGIAPKAGAATLAFVQITNPTEKTIVDRFAVSRAPMPLALAVAPNGAVTGVFRKPPSADTVAAAFVTPTMTRCMKAMQDGKVVLVCVQSKPRTPTPIGVANLQADPQFKDRVAAVALTTQDPAEADFLSQLQLDAANSGGIGTVMLAPPGVLVGKFPPSATADEMAAALHEAGKCCDDENCKHHKTQSANPKTTRNPSTPNRR